MIKKTLYFGNPAYLSLANGQLVIKLPEVEKQSNLPIVIKNGSITTLPIEDLGIIVLDNRQITLTHGLVTALMANCTVIISCDEHHLPFGLMLPMMSNTTFNERVRYQLEATLPLKKQLWQQTVKSKIENQAYLIGTRTSKSIAYMHVCADRVKSGDSDNQEALAAAYYWKNIFRNIPDFIRGQDGLPPNNLLNYGYSILRAVVARSLVISGLLPVMGIHHHNKYDAYCLADDIMEPYRPFVDQTVLDIMAKNEQIEELTKEIKRDLLSIPTVDVKIGGKRSPLMVAVAQTTASLAKCFSGESRKIAYPSFP
jgi:CRISPR-associated protein Cas1